MSGRLRTLASDSVIYGLSGVISRFLTLWLVPIYTRVFTPADYGVLALVTTTMSVLGILAVLALDNSTHRWFWDTESTDDRKTTVASWAWCQLGVSSLLATLLFVFADPLAQVVVGEPRAGRLLRLAALTLPTAVLPLVINGWFRLQRRPKPAVTVATSASLLQILLTIACVIWLRLGLAGVFIAQALASLVTSTVAAVILRDWVSPRRFDRERLRAMLRYSLPLVPGGLAFWVVSTADRYFLRAFASVTDVGLFSIGAAIALAVTLVTGAFQQAWSPFAMSIHKQPGARDTYARVFLAYIVVTSALATGVSLFAREAVLLLAPKQYLGAVVVVGPLAFSAVMIGLTYVASIGPAIVKVTRPTGVAFVVAAAAGIGLNFVLTPRYGMLGSAMATLISQSITPIYLFVRSQRLYPIPYRFGAGFGVLGVGLAMSLAAPHLAFSSLLVGIAVKLALMSVFGVLAIGLGLVPPVLLQRLRTLGRAG